MFFVICFFLVAYLKALDLIEPGIIDVLPKKSTSDLARNSKKKTGITQIAIQHIRQKVTNARRQRNHAHGANKDTQKCSPNSIQMADQNINQVVCVPIIEKK